MRGKYVKKTNKPRILPVLLVLLLAVVIAVGVLLYLHTHDLLPLPGPGTQPLSGTAPGVSESTPQQDPVDASEPESQSDASQQTEEFQPIELGSGLVITRVGKYAGMYMEDGSNEVVSNTLMLVLENRSDEALQYAQIILQYETGEAVFAVTNLPAGKQVVLLEQNRMPFTAVKPASITLESEIFVDSFSMYEDLFEITGADGCINVRNISDRDIEGEIYVYYKNVGGGMYYGGITYRAKVENGLAAGEIYQIMTGHYDLENSEILMVTCGE